MSSPTWKKIKPFLPITGLVLRLLLSAAALGAPAATGDPQTADPAAQAAFPVKSQAPARPLGLSGLLRNDAVWLYNNAPSAQQHIYNNVLESRLVLQKQKPNWKFYSDLRLYASYTNLTPKPGSQASQNSMGPAGTTGYEDVRFRLLRGFVRYYSGDSTITAGKTYINFGTAGVFNPFEIDKTVNFGDLSYAKEGLPAAEYHHALGDLSGLKVFGGFDQNLGNYATGLGLNTNLSKFDMGLVGLRRGRQKSGEGAILIPNAAQTILVTTPNQDISSVGAYAKGDLGIEINAAYNYGFSDNGQLSFQEFSAGLDYSFFDSKLLTALSLYLVDPLGPRRAGPQLSYYTYFSATKYGYGQVQYVFDEFLQTGVALFLNGDDGSGVVLPGVSMVVADGLTVYTQVAVLTGTSGDEFDGTALGRMAVLMRLEGKF